MQEHSVSAQQLCVSLGVDPNRGLTEREVRRRQEEYGKNALRGKKETGVLARFFAQFKDFMILILLLAAAVSFVTARIHGEEGYTDSVVILGIVILNAVIGTIQETKAQNALRALRALSAPHACVLRDGRQIRVAAEDLVPGDILRVQSGDRIGADARILDAVSATAQESALTGESEPAEKHAGILAEDCPAADRKNMLFAATELLTGHCTAVVCRTGMQTEIGKIAGMIDREQTPKTPLQIKLAKVSRVLGAGALGICGVIFLLGVWRHVPILESFLLSVSLAVAAIPEGLPAIVTVVLSLGVQRMAKRGAILTSLPAVETLGSATVICSDKTGTLTQNRMTVVRTLNADGKADLQTLSMAALCCNAVRDGKTFSGEPTEKALLRAAGEQASFDALRKAAPRIAELPFDSVRKRMSTLHRAGNDFLQITKGAPDVLLPLCSRCRTDGGDLPLTQEMRRRLDEQNRAMAADALRVLAVACRRQQGETIEENDLTFLGFVALRDPPRPETADAVADCKRAGIVPVMITGDHAVTATAVGRRIGICGAEGTVLTGSEIEAMDDEALQNAVENSRIFARVTPEHKVRIVRAFRARGEVVAMTGDGVNDAPALKAADIGCAMGRGGTDVAKGAADMILSDDNFATIVDAVAEGRGIYDNIRKAVHFLLSSNIGEILVVLAATIFALPAPLLPIQLLWVNLVTDSLPALALGTEPRDADCMRRPPLPPDAGFFSGGLALDIVLEGFLVGTVTLLAFLAGQRLGSVALGRTMAFSTLSFSEILYAVSMRSPQPIRRAGLRTNKRMLWAAPLCILLQSAVLTVPVLRTLFQTVPLHGAALLHTVLLSALPFAALEAFKLVRTEKTPRRLVGFVGRLPGSALRRRRRAE